MAALKSDTPVELCLRGRFNFGIDQWAYVPFDVPEGTRRIDVSTSHDQFSLLGIGRNVLDLGIFGPAGHKRQAAECQDEQSDQASENPFPKFIQGARPLRVLFGR